MAAAFAFSPTHANANQVVNFSTAGGTIFLKQAVRGLYDEGDLYDLHSMGLKMFLDTLPDRNVEQSWTTTFTVPKDLANPGVDLPLLTTDYGRVSLP